MLAFPNLIGVLPQSAEHFLKRVRECIVNLDSRSTKLESAGYITSQQADFRFSAPSLSASLRASGQSPLNVTNLIGKLAEPQYAFIPRLTALPSLADPLSQDGTLIYYNEKLYVFDAATEPGRWIMVGTVATLIEDTHANRLASYPAADYPLYAVFYETDRTVFYHNVLIGGVKTWVYLSGTMRGVQADIAGLGLGADDDGFTFEVTDFEHVLRWSWGGGPGAFNWVRGDGGSGFVQGFAVAPTGVGWKLADGTGSPVTILLADGTTTTVVLPDLTAGVFPKYMDAYTGLVLAPIDPTIAGDTADEAAHTHPQTGPTGGEAAHTHGAGTLDAAAASAGTPTGANAGGGDHYHQGLTDPSTGTTIVQSGAGASVQSIPHGHPFDTNPAIPLEHTHAFTGDPMANHDHPISGDTGAGSAHNHTLPADTGAGSAHRHGVGTLAVSDGQPQRIILLPYLRK